MNDDRLIPYPNPFENGLTISLAPSISSKIERVLAKDILGRTVFDKNEKEADLAQISLRNQSSGLYLVQVVIDDIAYIKSVIKI